MGLNELLIPIVIVILSLFLVFSKTNSIKKNNNMDIEIASGNENALVILMHGLGDTPAGWAQIAKQFKPALPYIKWILPCAPENPVSVNGGMKMTSWMDILESKLNFIPKNLKKVSSLTHQLHSSNFNENTRQWKRYRK